MYTVQFIIVTLITRNSIKASPINTRNEAKDSTNQENEENSNLLQQLWQKVENDDVMNQAFILLGNYVNAENMNDKLNAFIQFDLIVDSETGKDDFGLLNYVRILMISDMEVDQSEVVSAQDPATIYVDDNKPSARSSSFMNRYYSAYLRYFYRLFAKRLGSHYLG